MTARYCGACLKTGDRFPHVSTEPAPLRALIYNRVSSDPSGRGLSVASQETENRAYCQREGWRVVAAVTDNDLSASAWATKSRPGFTEVQRRIVAGDVDVLVCWEASRAYRDLAAYTLLRELCAG